MHQSRKRSLALAVALAVYAPGILAAAPSQAMAGSPFNNAPLSPPGWMDFSAPTAAALLSGNEIRFPISRTSANGVTLCTRATFAAAQRSTATELCFDSESVPPHDLLNASLLVSAAAPASDGTWSTMSPTWTGVVALSAPAASAAASSPAQPDLRPDHPPVPPPVWNIWAPVSASAPGGSGTWTLTSATWTDANGDARAAMSPQPGAALFQGAPGTVTVDDSAGVLSVTGMHFAIDGYTLAGDALNLVGSDGDAPTVEVGNGGSGGAGYEVIINNVLTGADGLIKTGTGTLTLAGSNTYTGETDVGGGTLALVGNGSIADSNGVMIYGTGTLDISGTANGVTIRNLENDGSTDGSVVLGGNTLTISNAYGEGFTGTISGAGGLAISDGWFTLRRAAYTGLTTIDAGAGLQIGFSGRGASIAGDILDNGTLEFFHNDDVTYDGVISGTGSLIQEGTGKLTLTGANTFNGGTSIVELQDLATGQFLTGTLQIGNGGTSGSVEGNIRDYGSLVFDRSDALTYDGVISGTGSLTQAGTSALTLTGVNTYTGGTTIDSGSTLALAGSGSIATSSGVYDAGTLDVSGITAGGAAAVIQSLSGTGAVTLGTQTLTLSNASDEFSGVITGGGALTLSGGSETLSGGNSYSGGTTINAGTLQIGNGGTTGSITGNVTDDGSLVFDRGDAVTYGNFISGAGSVTQAGAGTLTLTGMNTYSGGTNINAGVLQVSSDANLGGAFGAVSIDGGTLQAGASFISEHTIAVGNLATIDTNGYALTLDGISGSVVGITPGVGTLVKKGAGTLTFSVLAGPAWGSTTINAGTLALAGPVAMPGQLTIASGATFDISPYSGMAVNSSVSALGGDGIVALGSNTLDMLGGNVSWTFDGVIADGGTGGGTGGGSIFMVPTPSQY